MEEQNLKEIFKNICRLRESRTLCDVVLESVDRRQFHAHKLILVCASPYFKIVFEHSTNEFTAAHPFVVDMNGDALSILLNFMYGKSLAVDHSNVLIVMTGARLLMMELAVSLCVQLNTGTNIPRPNQAKPLPDIILDESHTFSPTTTMDQQYVHPQARYQPRKPSQKPANKRYSSLKFPTNNNKFKPKVDLSKIKKSLKVNPSQRRQYHPEYHPAIKIQPSSTKLQQTTQLFISDEEDDVCIVEDEPPQPPSHMTAIKSKKQAPSTSQFQANSTAFFSHLDLQNVPNSSTQSYQHSSLKFNPNLDTSAGTFPTEQFSSDKKPPYPVKLYTFVPKSELHALNETKEKDDDLEIMDSFSIIPQTIPVKQQPSDLASSELSNEYENESSSSASIGYHTDDKKYLLTSRNCDEGDSGYSVEQNVLYSCNQCDYKSKYRYSLKLHIRNIHTHSGIKQFRCPYCSQMYTLNENCRRHIKKAHPDCNVYVEKVWETYFS